MSFFRGDLVESKCLVERIALFTSLLCRCFAWIVHHKCLYQLYFVIFLHSVVTTAMYHHIRTHQSYE